MNKDPVEKKESVLQTHMHTNIIINNHVYDITTFKAEHPGGAHVFDAFETDVGVLPDLTAKFNEVGHSEYAVNLLRNYQVAAFSDDDPRFRRLSELVYNKTKISKLLTHEDKFHLHKIMGAVSLFNYFYLIFDLLYSGGKQETTLRSLDGRFIGLTWVHTILSLSSLGFLVPRERTGVQPMIWQEFRAHSIVFATRSFLIVNAMYFLNMNKNPAKSVPVLVLRLAVVQLAMKLSDFCTLYFREKRNESTTATMPYWSDCPPSLQASLKYFYTHAQFMATLTCLFAKTPIVLGVAFPIQFAAFLMTLVRKRIISTLWYHILYSASLLIIYLSSAGVPKTYPSILLASALIYARANLKLNKYVLWTLVAFLGSKSVSGADRIRISMGVVLSACCYYFARDGIPPAKIVRRIVDVVFEKHRIREESNHRVQKNPTVGKGGGLQLFHKITIQLCERFPQYKPGMYFNLYSDTKKRPYTPVEYATTDGGDVATFLIKRVQSGEVSSLICDKYVVNQTVTVKGPYGTKYYDPSSQVKSFVCSGVKINATFIVMCSCGTGITPFYSMGLAWNQDRRANRQELHYLSSYRTSEEAVSLRVPTSATVKESLFISKENTKLTALALMDYLSGLLETPDGSDDAPENIAVFVCGTAAYSKMVKDACASFSALGVQVYEW